MTHNAAGFPKQAEEAKMKRPRSCNLGLQPARRGNLATPGSEEWLKRAVSAENLTRRKSSPQWAARFIVKKSNSSCNLSIMQILHSTRPECFP
jgi:hypothetical protein